MQRNRMSMHIRYLTIFALVLVCITNGYARRVTIHTLPEENSKKIEGKTSEISLLNNNNTHLHKQTKFDKLTSSKLFEIVGLGVPAVVAGVAVKSEDNRFSAYKKSYPRTFECGFDDYIQYIPLATKYIMKLSRVKGRSSWGRMITSDILSVVLMAGSVELLKHTMDMPRPDDSEYDSFPSGHTATAFMAATLLNKEYGDISPWIPVASYTIASATAMGRQFNSRHWVSDLAVGAGIGILSAELGYYFADLIFKDKGLLHKSEVPSWEYGRKPSRFTTMVGVSTVLGNYTTTNGKDIDVKAGNRVAFEGVWFPHKNIGVGGRVGFSNNMVAVEENIIQGWLGNLSLYAGAYYEGQITSRWAVGTKTLFGYNIFSGGASWDKEGVSRNDGSFGFMTGLSLAFLAKENLRFSMDCDYNLITSSRVTPTKMQHELFVGATTSVMF